LALTNLNETVNGKINAIYSLVETLYDMSHPEPILDEKIPLKKK
jgi:hypothetical protein